MMHTLTEIQAMQKFCPLMKSPCLGNGCMWWKWIAQEFSRNCELYSKSKGIKVNSAFRDDAEWRPMEGEPTEPPPPVGHCSAIKSTTWRY